MTESFFLSLPAFEQFIQGLLRDSKVIAPVRFGERNVLEEITPEKIQKINLSSYRTIESFKSYLFKLTEKVSRYFNEDEPTHGQKIVFLGARGCDLEAVEILDRVLIEGEFADPYYAANRKEVLIISADCTDCGESCFCSMVGGKPYPQKLYDLNLTPIGDGYVVEVGTDKGKKLIEKLAKATDQQLKERESIRKRVATQLEEKNKEYKGRRTIEWSEAHKANLENLKAWKTLTKDCVECSACNFICPTCTCFLLLDAQHNTHYSRHKIWDACLKAGYARVAGGANSRPKLFERLQNRYHCKFDYSYDRLGRYACVGCGRCIDGCAGKIDMRKVYAELVKQVPLTAKLE